MRKILTAFGVLVLSMGAAAAQVGLDQPPATQGVTTKDAGSVSTQSSVRTVEPNGVVTDQAQSIDRSQSFESGDGALSAKTVTQTNGRTTVVTPPVVTEHHETTTTTEEH